MAAGAFIFVGCILVGTALGMVSKMAGIGAVLGTGVGFLIWGLIAAFRRDSLRR